VSAFLGRNPGLLTVVRAHECVFDGFQEHWPATNPDGTYNDDNSVSSVGVAGGGEEGFLGGKELVAAAAAAEAAAGAAGQEESGTAEQAAGAAAAAVYPSAVTIFSAPNYMGFGLPPNHPDDVNIGATLHLSAAGHMRYAHFEYVAQPYAFEQPGVNCISLSLPFLGEKITDMFR
jgi:hypothetical protein